MCACSVYTVVAIFFKKNCWIKPGSLKKICDNSVATFTNAEQIELVNYYFWVSRK